MDIEDFSEQMVRTSRLEEENTELRKLVAALQAENAELRKENDNLREDLDFLAVWNEVNQ